MAMTSQIGHWIGDAERFGPMRFEVYEPATAEQYAEASDGGRAEVEAAVTTASAAYRNHWGRLSAAQRADVLNACLIFDDADLAAACQNALFSAFWNTGQICTSGSRIFVQDGVFDEFCSRFTEAAGALRIGLSADPETQLGPMISAQAQERTGRAIAAGCHDLEVLYAGTVPAALKGWYVAPHVFRVRDAAAPLLAQEIFGPVTCIMSFSTDDDGIALANDSVYGLSSFVWSNDIRRIARCTRELETGRVWVNTGHSIPPDMTLPPWKMSGLGAEGGMEGLVSFTRVKTVSLNVGSSVPGFWGAPGG